MIVHEFVKRGEIEDFNEAQDHPTADSVIFAAVFERAFFGALQQK
jgi:hypothetical protein